MNKYEVIAERIKEDTKDYSPGTFVPGVQKLSDEYNANFKTVNRAIHRLIQENYLHRIRGKGTFTTCKLEKKHGILAMITPTLSNPIFLDYINEAENLIFFNHKAEFFPYSMLMASSFEIAFLKKLKEICKNPKLIKFPTVISHEKTIRNLLKKEGIKTVIMNDFWLPKDLFPSVKVDDGCGARIAVEHLVGLGHKRIAYLDESAKETRKDAFSGYKKTLQKHGIKFERNLAIFCGANSEKTLERVKQEEATAIYSPHAVYALKTVKLLKEKGYAVPGDISVVCGEETEAVKIFGLTALRHPKKEMISKALDILFGQEKKKHFMFQPELVIRRTTAQPKQ